MKVILIQNIPTLGKAGEIKNVADGYAVNFLLPKKLATTAGAKNIAQMKINSLEMGKKEAEIIANQKGEAQKISGMELKIAVKAKDGKLFGSVGTKEIRKALEIQGIKVESQQIFLPESIKVIGEKEVTIKFNKDIKAKITVKVTED
jgi:large subunit ribosomal protein L9